MIKNVFCGKHSRKNAKSWSYLYNYTTRIAFVHRFWAIRHHVVYRIVELFAYLSNEWFWNRLNKQNWCSTRFLVWSSYNNNVWQSNFETTSQGQRVISFILLISFLPVWMIMMRARHRYLLSTNIWCDAMMTTRLHWLTRRLFVALCFCFVPKLDCERDLSFGVPFAISWVKIFQADSFSCFEYQNQCYFILKFPTRCEAVHHKVLPFFNRFIFKSPPINHHLLTWHTFHVCSVFKVF